MAPAHVSALAFPGWFGKNWDALADSLGDLSWRKGIGHVLVFRDCPPGDDGAMLLDVLRSAAEHWAKQGKPFFAILLDPAQKLELPDLYRDA